MRSPHTAVLTNTSKTYGARARGTGRACFEPAEAVLHGIIILVKYTNYINHRSYFALSVDEMRDDRYKW